MVGVEGVLPGPPHLFSFCITVPLRAVIGKGVDAEEVGCGECRNPVIGDWEAGLLGLFLFFLHRHDELENLRVAVQVDREFAD